jgi:epsilon-lactone hydrolase
VRYRPRSADAERRCATIAAAYDEHIAQAAPEDQVIMGDSAGGALSLVLARQRRDEGKTQPANIILISPWLDITMTDPAVPILDRRDPYLSTPGLLEAGRMYAGDLDPRDPRVSPLNGELKGLGRLSVFVGTRDVLLIDSRHLRRQAAQQGIRIDYFEYRDMFHAWVLQRIPEGRKATGQIVDIVRGHR